MAKRVMGARTNGVRRMMLYLILGLLLGPFTTLGMGQVQFDYDKLNRLIRVTDSDGNVTIYVYDEVGNMVSTIQANTADQPVITGVTPDPVHRGETVEIIISGDNFFAVVLTTDNPGISVVSSTSVDTEVTAALLILPDARLGPTTLTVSTVLGFDSIDITVREPRPIITSISPSVGGSGGGTPVSILGRNFTADTTITVGGNPATEVVFVNTALITATTPAGTPGLQADVVASNSIGSFTLTGGFGYTFPFTVPGVVVIATGGTGAFTVTLDQPVTVDTTAFLSSSNPLVATVPDFVIIPAGARSVVIPITAVSEGTTTITITIDGESLTTTVFVTAPFTEALNPILAPVAGAFVTPITDGPILAPVAGAFVTPITDGPTLAPVVGVCVATALVSCNEEFDALGR